MGNALPTGRGARLAAASQTDPAAVVEALNRDPRLLTAKHAKLGGTIFHHAARTGDSRLLQALIEWVASR